MLRFVAHMATPTRTIPQRELRNNVAAVLRDVENGARVRVTVRGKPVADLIPVTEEEGPRRFVPMAEIRRLLEETPVDADFTRDVEEALDRTVDLP